MRDQMNPGLTNGDDGGASGRNEAVSENAEPGSQLAHLFPPLVVDGVGGEPTQGYKENDSEDGV